MWLVLGGGNTVWVITAGEFSPWSTGCSFIHLTFIYPVLCDYWVSRWGVSEWSDLLWLILYWRGCKARLCRLSRLRPVSYIRHKLYDCTFIDLIVWLSSFYCCCTNYKTWHLSDFSLPAAPCHPTPLFDPHSTFLTFHQVQQWWNDKTEHQTVFAGFFLC